MSRRLSQQAYANWLVKIDRPRHEKAALPKTGLGLIGPDPSLPSPQDRLSLKELDSYQASAPKDEIDSAVTAGGQPQRDVERCQSWRQMIRGPLQ